MTKEEFIAEIESQKLRGEKLLQQVQQMHVGKNDYGDSIAVFGTPRMYYTPKEELEPVKTEYESWKCYVHDLLLSVLDKDDDFVSEWDLCLQQPYRRDVSDKVWYSKEINKALGKLDSFTQRIGFRLMDNDKQDEIDNQVGNGDRKTPMVFISHSSLDKEFVEALVTLLESMGFDNTNLFCSSVPDYWIGLSQNIFESLRFLFNEHELYVIFVQSPRYYKSPVSLNEMGAAWVLRNDCCSILTKDMTRAKMQGVVNSSTIYIKVDTPEAGPYLNELKKMLTKMFNLPLMTDTTWERKRNTFLKAVNAIEYMDHSTSPTPLDDEYKRLQVEKLKREEMERKQAKVRGNIIEGRSKGSRILKVFNAGQSKARKVSVEWLNPDDSIIVQQKFGLLGEISPQSSRSYNMVLCDGHTPTMRLRYTWSDDNDENNTYEEDVQI